MREIDGIHCDPRGMGCRQTQADPMLDAQLLSTGCGFPRLGDGDRDPGARGTEARLAGRKPFLN